MHSVDSSTAQVVHDDTILGIYEPRWRVHLRCSPILELVPLDDLCPMDEVATRLRALLKWAIQLFRRAYNTDIARVQGSSVGQLPSRRILKLHLATIDLGCIRSDPSLGNSLLGDEERLLSS